MKITLSNKVELHYEVMGEGSTLLMLHGNGDYHKDLLKLGTTLSENYTVYLMDSRGHGKSSHHHTNFVYEDFAEDIHLFIMELKLKQVNIIGHSDGVIIATLLAMNNKE